MKRIGIEALLAWAYRQELPKTGSGTVRGHAGPGAGLGGWDMVSEFGELHALIDMSNHWGCVPDFSTEAYPHPDAVLVGQAVARLADAAFEAGEGYDVLGDLRLEDGSALTDAERNDCHRRGVAIARINGARMPATIARLAILGTAPEWGGYAVARKPVTNAQGGPAWFRKTVRPAADGGPDVTIEIDGYDRQRQRPHPGAYRRTRLTPDPVQIVIDRVEYQAWVLALASLVADLDGVLADHVVDGPDRSLWPWEGEEQRQAPRVLFPQKPAEAAGRACRVA
ncbi:hypothetical protein [Aurantimonas coralicida]|uniref:hypothetical protein n=1 Tax=Aurantimonas coralicida TaxID=182270 RepID=UPI001E38D107|nr:hypothetical protein [Aurantimonas coralicida]MCD1644312.1 hypothetical protein [Aurantimonas coralicida]